MEYNVLCFFMQSVLSSFFCFGKFFDNVLQTGTHCGLPRNEDKKRGADGKPLVL